jgi:hypothetical protein
MYSWVKSTQIVKRILRSTFLIFKEWVWCKTLGDVGQASATGSQASGTRPIRGTNRCSSPQLP